MCQACEINNGVEYKDLGVLMCRSCPILTSIPNIIGLQKLICCDCPILTSIPNIVGLQKLMWCNCPLLTSIPNIVGLQILICCVCPLLTNIPNIIGLQQLICCECPLLTSIPNITGSRELICCPWVSASNGFGQRMQRLVYLQRVFKKHILADKIHNLSNQLIPLWWDPNNKGGYFHKKRMLKEYD